MFRFEGAKGFYKGIVPNILRVTPACAITFIVYENTSHILLYGWSPIYNNNNNDDNVSHTQKWNLEKNEKKTLMMFNMSNSLKLFSFKFFVSFFISHLSFLVLVFTHKNTFRMFICNRNIFLFVYQLIYVSKISVDICNSFQFCSVFFVKKIFCVYSVQWNIFRKRGRAMSNVSAIFCNLFLLHTVDINVTNFFLNFSNR